MKNYFKILAIFVFIFVAASPAYANVPIVGVVYFMDLPLMLAIQTSGILLAVVVLLETVVFHRLEHTSVFSAFLSSLKANLYSSFVGFWMGGAYAGGLMALVGIPVGAWWFASMFVSLSRNTGRFLLLTRVPGVCFALFLMGGFFAAGVGYQMIPILTPHYAKYVKVRNEISFDAFVLGTVILVVSGFLLTCISEGYILTRKMQSKNPEILRTILIMNFVSYLALLILGFGIFPSKMW